MQFVSTGCAADVAVLIAIIRLLHLEVGVIIIQLEERVHSQEDNGYECSRLGKSLGCWHLEK